MALITQVERLQCRQIIPINKTCFFFLFRVALHCTIKNKLPYNVINHTLTVVFPSLLNNILHSNLPIPSNPPTFKTYSIHHMHVYIRWLSAEKKQHSFVIQQVKRSSRASHNIHAYTPHMHTFVIIISTKKKLFLNFCCYPKHQSMIFDVFVKTCGE